MDSFELNKIAGAVLGTVLLMFGINILSEQLFHTGSPETPGYAVEVTEASHGEEAAEPAAEEPIATLLASADADAGVAVFKKCAACHTTEEGGANKVGPNLWNIVNRPLGGVDGFSYSSTMADMGSNGESWSYDALNAFLIKPKDYVNGTKMAFAGIKKASDRANLIAHLRSLSAAPADLPMAEPAGEADMEKDASAGTNEAEAKTEMAANADNMAGESTAESTTGGETAAAMTEQPAAEAAPAAGETAPADGDAGTVLAMIGDADIKAGKKVAKKCAACHAFDEGGKNKVGPPLWGVVNGEIAAMADFKYSDSMKAFAEANGSWSYALLDTYLADPKGTVPKTKMAFAGIRKEADRAALLAYLRTLAADPAPLP